MQIKKETVDKIFIYFVIILSLAILVLGFYADSKI